MYLKLASQFNWLPRWLTDKESTCQVGDAGTLPGEGNGNPLQFACLGNPLDYSPWGHKRVGHNLETKQQQQASLAN